jgi:hypothetical protein
MLDYAKMVTKRTWRNFIISNSSDLDESVQHWSKDDIVRNCMLLMTDKDVADFKYMLGYHFLKALAECKTQVRFEKANKEACLAFVTDEISKVQTLRDEGTKFGPMFADFILKYSLLSEFTSHYELTFDFDKAKKFTFTNIDESRVDRKSI